MLDVPRDRLHLMPELCAMFACEPRTLKAACERHGVPLTRLSRLKEGLMTGDLKTLLRRAQVRELADG